MKDDIRNIIDLEGLIKNKSSLRIHSKLPTKNSLVKLIPIEYLEHGAKVLIDGKLFIANIDGNIPIKEEIIAVVSSETPFSLSLKIANYPKKSKNNLIDQIIKKFNLPNKESLRHSIIKVLEEDNVLIKSNILLLDELLENIKASGLELSLLINLVWSNQKRKRILIEDLYEKLFDEKFESICEKLFESINELLFIDIAQYIRQFITSNLVYDPEKNNTNVIGNKTKSIIKLVQLLNNNSFQSCNNPIVDDFIFNASKYILQKSVLKDYDFFPDFIIVMHNNVLTFIQYSIKKILNSDNQLSYKILFKHNKLPFSLTGIIRNNLIVGNLNTSDDLIDNPEIKSFQNILRKNWGFNSDIKINENDEREFVVSRFNTSLNKLVS